MNLSEFKYFVLNSLPGWHQGIRVGLRIQSNGQLTLMPLQSINFPDNIERVTGFHVDREGNLYLIDSKNYIIYRYLQNGQKITVLPCIGGCGHLPGQFQFSASTNEFSGHLASGKSTLYIADTYNHRIQAFYLQNFQIRFILGAKNASGQPICGHNPGEFNTPKDLCLDRKGNFYVLDYGNRRIQKFRKWGGFLYFIGQHGPGCLTQPESMTLDCEDCLYVIDAGKNYIVKYDPYGQWQENIGNFELIKPDLRPSAIAVDKNKNIYIGEKGDNNLKIYQLDATGNYLGCFGNYSLGCYQIIADNQDNLYANCGQNSTIIFFQGTHKYTQNGVYYSKTFDSTIKDCQWHRIALDADIAEKTKIDVYYYLSDEPVEPEFIDNNDWLSLISSPKNNLKPKDALFLNKKGRYLRLKIELFGDEYHTPTIRQVKLYFPRLSYLRYLPATYQEDPVGKYFLERFLSLFESMSYDMEEKIYGITQYFDSYAVDPTFINWLASWLGIVVDENWPDDVKRKFISRSFELYKLRGTPSGLKSMIEIFTGERARIIEHFYLKNPTVVGTNATVGVSTIVGFPFTKRLLLEETSKIGEFVLQETEDPSEKPFEQGAFDFTILANTTQLDKKCQLTSLKRLIEAEKPAHTRYFLCSSSQGPMQLGKNNFLEVNTSLGKGFNPMYVGIGSYVGMKTFLGTAFPLKGAIGSRSKIALDAILH